MILGSLFACAVGGDGRYSMTDTSTAVDKGSHKEKTVVRIARGSRERSTWVGTFKARDFVIFSVTVGSLVSHQLVSKRDAVECGSGFHLPSALVAPCSGLINGPNIL